MTNGPKSGGLSNAAASDAPRSIRVGESVMLELKEFGVKHVFGMPGTHSLELYRAIEESGIHHVTVRHEQGAAFMADGYARVSGQPGVCLVIGGPGVTNASTALAEAYADSVPVLMISNAIDSAHIGMGRNMVHELADQRATTAAFTTASILASNAEQVQAAIAQAFGLFASIRPRPYHLSIPIDVLKSPANAALDRVVMPERPAASLGAVKRAADLLRKAKRPVILAGGGSVDAHLELRELVDALRIPVVMTTAGTGVLPEDHELSLGSALIAKSTLRLLCDADVVLAIGTEIGEADLFDTADMEADQSTDAVHVIDGVLPLSGKLIRIDIDPMAMTDGRYRPEMPLLGDSRATLRALLDAVNSANNDSVGSKSASTWDSAEILSLRSAGRGTLSTLQRKHIAVLDELAKALPRDAFMVGDLAQINTTCQSHFARFVPRSMLAPLGFSTLGYALPAAIGAKLACPSRAGIAVVGDGGFMFTMSELATAVEQKLSLPILLWNNGSLGEIRDYMRARNIPEVGVSPHNPDFIALAQAFGCTAISIKSLDEISPVITEALGRAGPTLIEIREDASFLCDL
jgi:5-guanidino-2-oxopentanoate decarboxylase